MTNAYLSRSKYLGNWGPGQGKFVLSQHLRREGYHTALAGKFTFANLINGTVTSSLTSDIYPGYYDWPVIGNWDEPEIRLDYNFDGENKKGNKKGNKKDKAKLFNLTWKLLVIDDLEFGSWFDLLWAFVGNPVLIQQQRAARDLAPLEEGSHPRKRVGK